MDFFHGSLVLEKDVSFFLILENKTQAIEICNFSSLSKMSLLDALETVKIVAQVALLAALWSNEGQTVLAQVQSVSFEVFAFSSEHALSYKDTFLILGKDEFVLIFFSFI